MLLPNELLLFSKRNFPGLGKTYIVYNTIYDQPEAAPGSKAGHSDYVVPQ